jgi:hypothetical protein
MVVIRIMHRRLLLLAATAEAGLFVCRDLENLETNNKTKT